MSVAEPVESPAHVAPARLPGLWFAAGFVVIAVLGAVLAGVLPVAFSIATVFLFAGPHNWLEARYALGRLPARAGKLRGFFLVSLTGILGLTASFAVLSSGYMVYADAAHLGTAYAAWNTAFVFWVAGLVNAFPAESVRLYELARAGKHDGAFALYRWFLPLLRLDTVTKFVQLIKLVQQEMGWGHERVRPPRLELVGAEREECLRVLREALAHRPAL